MISIGDKKLFLIDAYALIYRAYFAFSKNPRLTSKGFDVSAIYGFTNILLELINNEKPQYLAVVFDTPKKTHRHIEFVEYKANRDAMPEGISAAIPYIKRILQDLNIPAVSLDGYEADDVIGTIAKKASIQGFQIYMMTPDKDFAQLVEDNILMYRPGIRGNPAEIWNKERVCSKFDIDNVNQVIDILGMVGDAVDNIPGIAGVGPKTASKLLKEYGSLENIYHSIKDFDGKLEEKLIKSKDIAFLSKKLATIVIDAPVDIDYAQYKMQSPNLIALQEVCDELEFKGLYKRIHKKFSPEKNIKQSNVGQLDIFSIDNNENNLIIEGAICISTVLDLRRILLDNKSKLVSLFIINNGLSFSFSDTKVYYVLFTKSFTKSEVIIELEPIINNNSIEKIFYNYKDFLITSHITTNSDIYFFDVAVADYLINPESSRTLLSLSQKYNIDILNIELLDLNNQEHCKSYLIESARLLYCLKDKLDALLDKNKLKDLFYKVELPLVSVLFHMELNGIMLDVEALTKYSQILTKQLLELTEKIHLMAGESFKISSPKQLGSILFEKMKLVEKPKKTKTGQFATSESELVKLKGKHDIIDSILLFRTYQKLLSTYVNALPLLIHQKDKKIHTTFNQLVTSTGRLSSSRPNLQNIPIRRGSGKEVRKSFIASSREHLLMSADYSQIELRLIAELSNEDNMIEAFLNDQDIHASTASKVFHVPLNEVTSEMRTNAKTINFGIIYGVSAFGLSEQSTLNRKEAANLIQVYFETYPKLKVFIDDKIRFAKQNNYAETILGRRRHLLNINSRNSFIRGHDERNAVNMPVQGSAADVIKLAMIKIHDIFIQKKLVSKMILQVHDELVFDVFKKEKDSVYDIVKYTMENIYPTKVPLKVDIGFGENWLQAH